MGGLPVVLCAVCATLREMLKGADYPRKVA